MIKSRIACIFALFFAALFYIFYMDYFSYYLLIYIAVVLTADFLAFLPGAITMRSALTSTKGNIPIGGTFAVDWAIRCGIFPFVCVGAEVTFENALTGEKRKETIRSVASWKGRTLALRYTSAHCGLIRCEVKKLRVYDALGVFSWKKRERFQASALCVPSDISLLSDVELSAPQDMQHKRISHIPYGDYDLREYRPGDPLKNVHWKLSAKMGDFYVKEFMENAIEGVYLLMGHTSDPGGMDDTLAWAAAFAQNMLDRSVPFHIVWANPESKKLEVHRIEAERHLVDFLHTFLSHRLHDTPKDAFYAIRADEHRKRLFEASANGLMDINAGEMLEGTRI